MKKKTSLKNPQIAEKILGVFRGLQILGTNFKGCLCAEIGFAKLFAKILFLVKNPVFTGVLGGFSLPRFFAHKLFIECHISICSYLYARKFKDNIYRY
jgi:hypothetical protein